MTNPRRPPSPHLQALADFFESSDAEQGLRSSFGPLADMARAGFRSGSAEYRLHPGTEEEFLRYCDSPTWLMKKAPIGDAQPVRPR